MSLLELVLIALTDGTLLVTDPCTTQLPVGGVGWGWGPNIQIHDHSLVVKSSTVLK